MVCFDEYGPVEVRPQGGSAWAPQGRPLRRRADYTRRRGVRYFFSAYDVHADRLWMHQKRRKRWQETLAFLRDIRRRYPIQKRLHLVLDNLSTHKRKDVRAWCRANNVRLVFTATYASWMNRIECHVAPAKHFVIDNSDYPDHAAIARAMHRYLCWRNEDARNKEILKAQNTIRVL